MLRVRGIKMGVQHGAPTIREFNGIRYKLYKEYNPMLGEKEQKIDAAKLKAEGWKVRSVTIKKSVYRIIERSLYIRRPE
jgi:hypothetical protein